jgi:hypothetical protein
MSMFITLVTASAFLVGICIGRWDVDHAALAACRSWKAWGESHQELNRQFLDLWAATGHTPYRCGPCGGRPCRYVVPAVFEERPW